MKKVLIIEDDESTLAGIVEILTAEQFDCEYSENGSGGLEMALKNYYDIILLDLMLPGINGLDICKELRQRGNMTPVIMLTAKKEEIDKIVGFELGADDYITKPFSIRELLARIKAVLRRSNYDHTTKSEVEFGDVKINFKKQELLKADEEKKLSTTEFKVLHFMIDHEGEVISRNQLLDEVWGYDAFPTTRTVDNYILSLRKKIENDPANPLYLITVHKAGYKFVKYN